jgi:hypothetical protein
MYAKWMEFDGWTPFFRLDWHPWMYKSAALCTMMFELSFIFLLMFPRLRKVAALGGVLFHSASELFMRIFFYDLLLSYVSLFDLSSLLKKLGRRIFPKSLSIVYDGRCRFCRRLITVIRAFDVFDRMTFITSELDGGLASQKSPQWDGPAVRRKIHAVSPERDDAGMRAYRAMALRMPVLWPVLPFLFSARIEPAVDRLIHRRFFDLLSGGRAAPAPLQSVDTVPAAPRALVPVVVVGSLLLVANIYCGARGIQGGWPFACYPTFASLQGDEINSLEVAAVTPRGEAVTLDASDLKQRFTGQRLQGLVESLLRMRRSNPGDFEGHVKALWTLYGQQDPRLKKASTLRIYRLKLTTIPERTFANPVQRELIFEMGI